MNAQRKFPKPIYPGKVAIRHAVQAAKDCGLDPVGFEVSPDGTIRVFDKATMPVKPSQEESLYDRLTREGKL